MSKYSVKMKELLDQAEALKNKMTRLTKKEIKAEKAKRKADKKRVKSLKKIKAWLEDE